MPKIVDREARRREVVEAVWRIVVREGIEHASLRQVATEAGLAIGSVRHYFSSHEELLVAAAQELVDRLTGRLEAHAARVATATDRLALTEELLHELLPLDDQRRDEVQVWLAFLAAARTNPALADQARMLHTGTRFLVRKILSHTRHAGDEVEVERLCALVDGLAVDAVLQPGLLPPDRVRAALRRHLEQLTSS